MKARVLIILAAAILIFISPITSEANFYDVNYTESVPGPTLIYPITDNIDLSGKDKLEFKWMLGGLANTRYYEFKIYRGYNMYGQYLIYKAQAPADIQEYSVSVSNFEAGQVYTWSIRQVFITGRKSDKSFSSFKIIRK
jgi:hypothetical protein